MWQLDITFLLEAKAERHRKIGVCAEQHNGKMVISSSLLGFSDRSYQLENCAFSRHYLKKKHFDTNGKLSVQCPFLKIYEVWGSKFRLKVKHTWLCFCSHGLQCNVGSDWPVTQSEYPTHSRLLTVLQC